MGMMMTRVPNEVARLLEEPEVRRIAVVGATNARQKYGNIIVRDLKAKGFTVVPVNPNTDEVEGEAAYATLAETPGRIDIVDFVVPPRISLEVVRPLDPERFGVLWFQPGSFDDAVLEAVKRFDHVVAGPCIMVEARP